MLEIRGLTYAWPGAAPLFSGLDVTVAAGKVLAVVGRNGAGKSTFLRLLNGILHPGSGQIRLDGARLDGQPLHLIARHVGTMFQSPEQQIFAATVEDEVAFGPRQQGLSGPELRARAKAALRRCGLDQEGGRHPLDLDQGARLLLTLACVLASRPKLLILDEPQRGLDRPARDRLERIIGEERAAGHVIALVCHDMDFVDRVAQSVLALGGPKPGQYATQALFADEQVLRETGLARPWRHVLRDQAASVRGDR
jgi:energy-coupling factor transporter ATP-binding protein EcfA2